MISEIVLNGICLILLTYLLKWTFQTRLHFKNLKINNISVENVFSLYAVITYKYLFYIILKVIRFICTLIQIFRMHANIL